MTAKYYIDLEGKKAFGLDFDNTTAGTEDHAVPSLIKRFNDLYIYGTIKAPGAYVIDNAESLTYECFKEHFHGMGTTVLCQALSSYYNADIPVYPLYTDREPNMARHYQNVPGGIEFAPHCLDVAEVFQQAGKQVCVITNNPLERAFAALRYNAEDRKSGSSSYAHRFVSCVGPHWYTPGEKRKPEPDVYLFALEQMNLEPEEIIIIEDSATGLESAKRAGIEDRLGFTYFIDPKAREKHTQKLFDAGAKAVLSGFEQVPNICNLPFQARRVDSGIAFG